MHPPTLSLAHKCETTTTLYPSTHVLHRPHVHELGHCTGLDRLVRFLCFALAQNISPSHLHKGNDMIRQRRPAAEPTASTTPAEATGIPPSTMHAVESHKQSGPGEQAPLLPQYDQDTDALDPLDDKTVDTSSPGSIMSYLRQNRWMVLAIASGACAAFNGVFAKLYVAGWRPPWASVNV